ncbi:MAG: 3-hydroxyacyl-CoA dehydrogenase family protein [Xanthobacteraceae bacterium]
MSNFQKIGVVGAGMMGSEIALMFALAGYPTLLTDASRDAAERAVERLHGVLDRGLPRGFWTEEAAETARRQLSVADDLDAYADRDFVVEAVFEDEALKRKIFGKLDAILAPGAGLASNTSSISITTLSAAVAEPRRARFIGTHFFSPASRMKLVEVIPAADTDPAFVDAVMKIMVAIGKTPIHVKDVVGFAVNRLLHALVLESIRLVEEGVCSPADIDVACKLGLGHPIGPFELMDNTQNSLSLSVHEILYQAYGERFLPRPLLRQMVAAGYNGRKAGRGWHRYDGTGKKQ